MAGAMRADAPWAPDLRNVRILADRMHLWTGEGFLSKFTGAIAASALASGVTRLPDAQRPALFQGAHGIAVYQVDEKAVDASSLVAELASVGSGPILCGVSSLQVERNADPLRCTFDDPARTRCAISARSVILAAGAGNEDIIARTGLTARAQRRPLHMVMAHGAPGPLFGHRIEALSDKPRLTITTGEDASGILTWWIGGMVAEEGVGRDPAAQIAAAKAELSACLPWLKLDDLRFATVRIDRAEGLTPTGTRPDTAVVSGEGRIVTAWPTKLALAPVAAEHCLRIIRAMIGEGGGPHPERWNPAAAPVAPPPWREVGVQWN